MAVVLLENGHGFFRTKNNVGGSFLKQNHDYHGKDMKRRGRFDKNNIRSNSRP